jgi:hypothetical protein
MDLHDLSTVAGISGSQRVVGDWVPVSSLDIGGQSGVQWILLGRWAAGNAVQIIPIDSFPFRIGRGDGLQLSLPSLAVSRSHAEITNGGHALQVRDLSSRNGTYVNGCRVKDVASIDSDALLQFADIQFRVCLWDGDSAP